MKTEELKVDEKFWQKKLNNNLEAQRLLQKEEGYIRTRLQHNQIKMTTADLDMRDHGK